MHKKHEANDKIALEMAAHVGQTLLEDNIALKSSYDQLLHSAPYPTPTQSTSLLEEQEDEEWLEYIEPARTREALVEMLELQNMDLQNQLEQVMSNQEDLDRAHLVKSKQLQDQVEHLQNCLETATHTIQEMEENRKSMKTLTKDSLSTAKLPTNTCCIETVEKMKQLKSDYSHLSHSKTQIEKALKDTLNQSDTLRQQFELTAQDHEDLQRDFDEQSFQVKVLQTSLEEYQSILSRLRDRGVGSSVYSLSETSSVMSSSIYTDDYEMSSRRDNSLLTELNMAASKSQPLSYGNTEYGELQPNVDSTINSIIHKLDGVESGEALDDAITMLKGLVVQYDHTQFLQQKRHLCYKEEYQEAFDKIQELFEPVKYPSLDQYKTVAQNQRVQRKHLNIQDYPTSFIKLLLQYSQLLVVTVLAFFFSLKRGPASFNVCSDIK